MLSLDCWFKSCSNQYFIMTLWWGRCRDRATDNYRLALQFPSALHSSLFLFHSCIVWFCLSAWFPAAAGAFLGGKAVKKEEEKEHCPAQNWLTEGTSVVTMEVLSAKDPDGSLWILWWQRLIKVRKILDLLLIQVDRNGTRELLQKVSNDSTACFWVFLHCTQ